MFEYFTDRAKRAITASQDEALNLGHDFIGTEHLLLGLVATPDCTASEVFTEYGVELARARQETVRLMEAAGVYGTGAQDSKDALSAIGIDVAEIQRRADDAFGPGAFRYPRPAYTAYAKKVLEMTVREWRALGHDTSGTGIGTEHMLLGLLAAEEGLSHKVLATLDVNEEALRSATLSRTEPGGRRGRGKH
jgi:ATP-dependent Clp protease ATP-binding subunit ClpA